MKYKRTTNDNTIIKVKGATFGGDSPVIIGGPCSVESLEQMLSIGPKLKDMGVHVLRGSAFKPRSNPYDFQGLGEDGLLALKAAGLLTGLPTVTEILSEEELLLAEDYGDIVQIGTRNMQNTALLKAVGKSKLPVILKRGMMSTLSEWLNAAEYILSGGNENVILCERGIRTFETMTRNTLDLSAVPLLQELTHLPVIVDPSHGTGRRDLIAPMSMAAIAAGAKGLMIEVHENPEEALSDGHQSLSLDAFQRIVKDVTTLSDFLHKDVIL